jgi:hypothetical protein
MPDQLTISSHDCNNLALRGNHPPQFCHATSITAYSLLVATYCTNHNQSSATSCDSHSLHELSHLCSRAPSRLDWGGICYNPELSGTLRTTLHHQRHRVQSVLDPRDISRSTRSPTELLILQFCIGSYCVGHVMIEGILS